MKKCVCERERGREAYIGETRPRGRQPSELLFSSLIATEMGFTTPAQECVCVHVFERECVCMCVCRECVYMCVCVCVCVCV